MIPVQSTLEHPSERVIRVSKMRIHLEIPPKREKNPSCRYDAGAAAAAATSVAV